MVDDDGQSELANDAAHYRLCSHAITMLDDARLSAFSSRRMPRKPMTWNSSSHPLPTSSCHDAVHFTMPDAS